MIWLLTFYIITIFLPLIEARIHPIEIRGNHFYDSVTNKPFFIKGVDYQPGGSSGVNQFNDPLSNPDTCVRDIFLFQELGLNTIRVYSVNPNLNHDKCMTLLAAAGIYLVLDVNSPLPNQHLNRYEPWTTYNDKYMNRVFQVVNEFSGYNNTLAFFAGNEIINDKTSASNSPTYVKAVIRDMKHFIKYNAERPIPVGYSAADDLNYRISLAEYLECYENDPLESVDFYGVNTYQWCGEQTFQTSGYNNLVKDYSKYTKPIFFSEYGCNEVLPRIFKEIGSMYSSQMTSVFSGGLVYEFAQEPNNYGLVDYDEWGNVKLLPDFYSFKEQISKVKDVPLSKKLLLQNQQSFQIKSSRKQGSNRKVCELQYSNLDISKGIPRSMGDTIVKTFQTNDKKGKHIPLLQEEMTAKFKIFSADGTLINERPTVKPVPEPIADPNYSVSREYSENNSTIIIEKEKNKSGNENENEKVEKIEKLPDKKDKKVKDESGSKLYKDKKFKKKNKLENVKTKSNSNSKSKSKSKSNSKSKKLSKSQKLKQKNKVKLPKYDSTIKSKNGKQINKVPKKSFDKVQRTPLYIEI